MIQSSWRKKKFLAVKESLWFTPVLMVLTGATVGILLPLLDRAAPKLSSYVAPSPSASEALISTAAGALATILGVAFSVTIVTLQLTTAQYSSRILRRFMADRYTRWILGSYVSSVTYLAVVIRAIEVPSEGKGGFSPGLSVWLGLALFVYCVTLVAIFIHHLGRSIQSGTIVSTIGQDTIKTLEQLGAAEEKKEYPESFEPPGEPCRLTAAVPGYLQLVDEQALLECLPAGCRWARVEAHCGQFVLPGRPLLSMWPHLELDPPVQKQLREVFALGSERTVHQDVLYGIRQLADIALKALSPAVNDVTTSLMVVNEMGAIVARYIASGNTASGGPYRATGRDGVLLLVPRLELQTVLVHAFDEIPRAAKQHPMVLARILDVLAELAELSPDEEARRALRRTGRRVQQYVRIAELTSWERRVLRHRAQDLRRGRVTTGGDPVNPV